jgi:hypothetical protein
MNLYTHSKISKVSTAPWQKLKILCCYSVYFLHSLFHTMLIVFMYSLQMAELSRNVQETFMWKYILVYGQCTFHVTDGLFTENYHYNSDSMLSTLPLALITCETWSLMVKEEHTLRVFENGILRIFLFIGQWGLGLENASSWVAYWCVQLHKCQQDFMYQKWELTRNFVSTVSEGWDVVQLKLVS